MRPSSFLLIVLSAWCAFACVVGVVEVYIEGLVADRLKQLFWLSGAGIFIAAFIDFYYGRGRPKLLFERFLPAGFSVGTVNEYTLVMANRDSRILSFNGSEQVSASLHIDKLPRMFSLKPGEKITVKVSVLPTERGTTVFDGFDTQIESRWRFWLKRCVYLEPQPVRVFPNFRAVSNFALLTDGRVAGQLGIHIKQRRGEGLDFHQLREFRPGDALRQVDWKATSRALKPISREFQDEKDQDIIFLIDNGRRMRARDSSLSHFDHCLNAFLLTSYVALRQGDAVGFQVFGGDNRWVTPVKGGNNLNALMHQVYDLHSATATSDYLQAAERLMDRHRKRSLVIIMSNVNEQDSDDLLSAYHLLRKNHVVMFACLQETSVEALLDKPVTSFEEALVYSSVVEYVAKREHMLKRLRSEKAIVIDQPPSQLHIGLVNEYFALKRSGRI